MAACFWRCAQNRQCKGTLTTKEDKIISIADQMSTINPKMMQRFVASMAVEKMKQQVQEKINPVPGIYQQQLQEFSTRKNVDQVAANLPTFPSLKSSLYRLQRKHLPPIPTTREEVCFCREWARTDEGENFLPNLELLVQAEKIYVDSSTIFSLCMHSRMADSSP